MSHILTPQKVEKEMLILRNCDISSKLILRNCKIARSVQFAIRISPVQLILRNWEIAKSVKFAIRIAMRAADVSKLRSPARLRQTNWRVLHIPVLSECKNGVFKQYFLETFNDFN